MDFLNNIPIIGPAINYAIEAGSDFLFGDDQGMDDVDSGGFISDLFSGGKSSSSSRQTKAIGQAIGETRQDVKTIKRLSRQRAMSERTKNIVAALRTSTDRKRDEREAYIERSKIPIRRAAEIHLASAVNHYNNQLRKNGMSTIPDLSEAISDQAPRYTKSPTAIG